MASSSPRPVLRHVAMLPFMAKGHAMPLLHLARLLLRRGLASAVTFLATPRDAPFIRAGAPGAAVVELPFPSDGGPQSMEELPSASHLLDVVSTAAGLRPAYADALARLEPRPDLLVHDGFLPWAKDAADELGVPRLVSLGMGAFASYVSGAVLAQKPHARVSSPTEPFTVDGLPGLRLTKADLFPPFDEPEPAGPHWDFVCESGRCMWSSRGTIVNSFLELESIYIDKWNRENPLPLKMWPVGPLCLANEPVQALDPDLSSWLDLRLTMNRPVLYVAFGSQADLSQAQLEQIAIGLDRSDLDFIWVVRSKWLDQEDRFEGQFGDRGKVVQGFINQLGVLSHRSVKGFFSHCGWNSVMESISTGVPILAFPMAAEQKLNAKFVVDELGVGLRVWPTKRGDDDTTEGGLVASGDVQALGRELILGERGKRAAARASKLAASARSAMDAGGSSFETLELMVSEIGMGESKSE
ncbi:UDP-glycosyltransferase 90A1-like [Phragmites australis]|uniref:UDP-glycosyltransferase 90A1-like n=1 Tax=Phragmites australis TaxID=29695 RepID=UPI002D77EDF6|nr:UDP-glycosyltransferase 90A1-like [Phragmites australis]